MIDNCYSEHHAFDAEAFQPDYQVGETFTTLEHEFTYLGKAKLDHGLESYFDLDVYLTKDAAGIEQYVGLVRRYPEEGKEYDEMQKILEYSYPDIEFSWLWELPSGNALVPLEALHATSEGNYIATPEVPIWDKKWVYTDAREHVTRFGGFPSFGNAKEYGQPHGKNDSGEWKPLPFIAQYILPDGKFIHIYHVDDPEGYGGNPDQHLLDFGIENPYRSLILIQDQVIPEGFCLMPLKDGERSIVTEKAVTVEGRNWPKSVAYIQGPETDEEFPYALFHFPSGHGFGEDTDKMLTYTDAYVVWNGKDKAKLVEQYD